MANSQKTKLLIIMTKEKILIAVDPEKVHKEVKELCYSWFKRGCEVNNKISNEKNLIAAFDIMYEENKLKL